jgi:hypothetical protein
VFWIVAPVGFRVSAGPVYTAADEWSAASLPIHSSRSKWYYILHNLPVVLPTAYPHQTRTGIGARAAKCSPISSTMNASRTSYTTAIRNYRFKLMATAEIDSAIAFTCMQPLNQEGLPTSGSPRSSTPRSRAAAAPSI